MEWRESVPTVWRDVSQDQRRGLFSDWKDGSFGQDCRGCAARARQAMSRAVVACPRVAVSLRVGPERRQGERLCEPRWILARACLNAWRKPDENETGRRYREQPAERISLAFASDHPSGEAGGEFSYSTLGDLSSLDRDQMRHTVRDGGRAAQNPGTLSSRSVGRRYIERPCQAARAAQRERMQFAAHLRRASADRLPPAAS